ncbi:MAG: DinB family protein [Bacteroidetes bacterium]|nr:MAG: DinB family protein [Bacteroidota bacterium]
MIEQPYYTIPDCPEEITASNTIARFVDGLGFRYRWATEGLTESDLHFRPVVGSMDMTELLTHIFSILTYTSYIFGGEKIKTKPETFPELRAKTLEVLYDLSSRLKKMDDAELQNFKLINRMGRDEVSFWYFLNGPIADALTHVGQVVSWRRINGNPQPKGVHVFLGTVNFS